MISSCSVFRDNSDDVVVSWGSMTNGRDDWNGGSGFRENIGVKYYVRQGRSSSNELRGEDASLPEVELLRWHSNRVGNHWCSNERRLEGVIQGRHVVLGDRTEFRPVRFGNATAFFSQISPAIALALEASSAGLVVTRSNEFSWHLTKIHRKSLICCRSA